MRTSRVVEWWKLLWHPHRCPRCGKRSYTECFGSLSWGAEFVRKICQECGWSSDGDTVELRCPDGTLVIWDEKKVQDLGKSSAIGR